MLAVPLLSLAPPSFPLALGALAFFSGVANKNCWPESVSLRIIDSLIAHNRGPGFPLPLRALLFSAILRISGVFRRCPIKEFGMPQLLAVLLGGDHAAGIRAP